MEFAQINQSGTVINIVEISDIDCLNAIGEIDESVGEIFCSKVFGEQYLWKRSTKDGSVRKRPAVTNGGYDPVTDAFSSTPKPGHWARLSETGEWFADFPINVNTGTPLSHDELVYIFYHIRNTKGYRLCPAILKDPSDEFTSKACVTTDYMYPTFDHLAYGKNTVEKVVPYKIIDDKLQITLPLRLEKLIDLTPVGLILHAEFEVFTEHVIPVFNAHPQSVGRTPHELFRLIIEWAYAHTNLGNNELIAKTCHNLLRLVQMPLAVRNELLSQVPPQAVERYIRGEYPFAATDLIFSDPKMPPLFEKWFNQLISTNKKTIQQTQELFDLSTAPGSYPK